MTTVTRQVPVSLNRWTRRLSNLWRTFFASGDVTILFIAFALVSVPAWSLKAAGWPLAMNTLLPVLALSVLLGLLLARSHYNELFALILIVIYAMVAAIIVAVPTSKTCRMCGALPARKAAIDAVIDSG